MKLDQYESKQTLNVFNKLGFEIVTTNEYMDYLYHRDIPDEVIVDKKQLISNQIINKSISNVGIPDWIFDSLYENISSVNTQS